jgi:hypothetical protein
MPKISFINSKEEKIILAKLNIPIIKFFGKIYSKIKENVYNPEKIKEI